MRCRWRSAGAATVALVRAGRRAGRRRPRSSTSPADHPAHGAARRERDRGRRRPHPSPRAGRATARPAPSSTTSRCRVTLLRADRRGAGRDPRPARRPRAGRAEEHRRLLDAFGGLEAEADGGRRALSRLRRPQDAAARLQSRSRCRAAREADYLRAAVEELEALAPGARRGGRRSPSAGSS